MLATQSLKNQKYIVAAGVLLAFVFAFASIYQTWWVFAIPVGIAVIISSIIYTEKTLLFFGALAPLSRNVENLAGGFGMSLPTEPVYIFLFLLLIFQVIKEGKIYVGYLKHPVILAVTSYLIWLCICSIFSSLPMVSFKFTLARAWYITLFFYFGVKIFRDYHKIHWFIKAFTAFTMILVFYTLFMHAKEGFTRGSSYDISWPFFPDHGMYAAAIAFGFFTLLIYTLFVEQFKFHVFVSPVLLILWLILWFAIIVSFTRATWLSLLVAASLWVVMQLRIKFIWILLVVFLVGTVGVVKQDEILYALEANKQGSSDELEGHVKSVSNITTDPSNLERINRWKCASRMVSERPVFGFGPGTYVFKYGPFQKSSELTLISTNAGDLGDAHSEFFSAMSETGFLGMFLFISIVLTTLATSFKVIYTSPILKVRLTAYIAIMGLVTYYSHAFLNNYTQYDKLAVPFWGFTAIIVALDLFHKQGIFDAKKAI